MNNNSNTTEPCQISDEDWNAFFDFDLFYEEPIENTNIDSSSPCSSFTYQPNSILLQDDTLGTHQPCPPISLLGAALSQGTEHLISPLDPKDKGAASPPNGCFPNHASIPDPPTASLPPDHELRPFPKRAKFSSEVREKVRIWLDLHEENPYPSKEEKEDLANSLQLSVQQISTLFNNERRRYKKGISYIGYYS